MSQQTEEQKIYRIINLVGAFGVVALAGLGGVISLREAKYREKTEETTIHVESVRLLQQGGTSVVGGPPAHIVIHGITPPLLHNKCNGVFVASISDNAVKDEIGKYEAGKSYLAKVHERDSLLGVQVCAVTFD